MNKSKLFVFLAIALLGITLSVNIMGCKKDAPVEEETMEDESADVDTAEETE